ncbi:hypothetical protein VRY85_14910, partial [Achromobacter sp. F4_2707]|uniref:hypothetical protein n=1 Tax=Achromobacter sp. F4_2707 TaxID=3114286 RepID=UPI0039C6A222
AEKRDYEVVFKACQVKRRSVLKRTAFQNRPASLDASQCLKALRPTASRCGTRNHNMKIELRNRFRKYLKTGPLTA